MLMALLTRIFGSSRATLLMEFLKFGVVGTTGFVVDASTVYATRSILGLYGAGILAYLFGATSNWMLNRAWTFRGKGSQPAYRQWAIFLVANSLGFVLNRGTYAILVTFVELCAAQPIWAVAAGSIAGLGANFFLSRRLVFR
jgi:putative flippase GtrA